MYGFISGLFTLFHCSIYLFLCQNHAVVIIRALQQISKSGSVMSLALFAFFAHNHFSYLRAFVVPRKFFPLCEKWHWNFCGYCIEFVDHFGTVMVTMLIFPTCEHRRPFCLFVIFNVFHQCFIVFSIQIFHLLDEMHFLVFYFLHIYKEDHFLGFFR